MRHTLLLFTVACTREPVARSRAPVPPAATDPIVSATSSTAPGKSGVRLGTPSDHVLAPCVTPRATGPLSLVVSRDLEIYGTGWAPHAGRVLDENGDGVIDATDPQQLVVSTAGGQVVVDGSGIVATLGPTNGSIAASIVELDGIPGAEYVGDDPFEQRLTVWSGVTQTADFRLPGEVSDVWFSDLDADGAIEMLTTRSIRDARTRDIEGEYDTATTTVSADLDLDGVQEVVTAGQEDVVAYLDPAGNPIARCSPGLGQHALAVAVGNLDDDDEGEVVVGGTGFAAVCDTDGSVVRAVSTDGDDPAMVGLGELDGDPEAEVVIGATGSGLYVYDTDLTLLWSFTNGGTYWPFALVDLDGDGYHEVLVRQVDPTTEDADLLIFGADGAIRGSAPVEDDGCWKCQAIVADIDADGLAEIALAGGELPPKIQVLDDGVAGGWSVPDADLPWPGWNHFPGDRGPLGEIPSGAAPGWLAPERNVWQGTATWRHPSAGCP